MRRSKVLFFSSFLIAFLGIFFIGYLIGHRNLEFGNNYRPKITNTELYRPKEVDFSLFWTAWNDIESKYVRSYDRQKMLYGAISGMVESLDDPYSVFLEPKVAKDFLQSLEGHFDGIGAELSVKDGKLIVVAPLDNSPAAKAGLQTSDQILKINDETTETMALDEAVSKIRGTRGTKVTLQIFRESWPEPKDFTIQRENIVIKSVELEWKDDNVAVIKISQFGDDTVDLMKQAADEIIAKKGKGVIVDVRDNPGGYLQASIDISSLFIDKGVVVIEKRKDGEEKSQTTISAKLKDLPLVVLVNKGSASASEIFAGAIRDNQKGKLIGEKTFGKGSVQSLEPLDGGGANLRLTIAEWLTPNGQAINGMGIDPDIEVKLTEDDVKNEKDPQLERALQEIK